LNLASSITPALRHLDLQLHHVAAGRRADHAGTDAVVFLGEGTDVTGIFVVIQTFTL
jgi:hypothetical protein